MRRPRRPSGAILRIRDIGTSDITKVEPPDRLNALTFAIYQELAEVFGRVGVLALPSMTAYPARVGEHAVAPNRAAAPINLAGHPAVSLPVPSGGVFPASLQLVAPDHHEPRLLATAALVEAAVAPR